MSAGNEREFIDHLQSKETRRNVMSTSEGDRKVTDRLYRAYASYTGYLFGIEPSHKEAVVAIVSVILGWVRDKQMASLESESPIFDEKSDEVYIP